MSAVPIESQKTTHPYHVMASALGIAPGGGCLCAFCGPSPFGAAGLACAGAKGALSGNFTEWQTLRPHPEVCKGCAGLLGGHPSREPRPVRLLNLAIVDGEISRPTSAELLRLVLDPPGSCILSWATSNKKHHWRHAGLSSPELVQLGSDAGTIRYRPRQERRLFDECLFARKVLPRRRGEAIGDYKARLVESVHHGLVEPFRGDQPLVEPGRLQEHLEFMAPHRGRPVLDFFLLATPAKWPKE